VNINELLPGDEQTAKSTYFHHVTPTPHPQPYLTLIFTVAKNHAGTDRGPRKIRLDGHKYAK